MTADAVGGVWGFTLELAAGLSALGAEVHVATMGPAPRRDQRQEARAMGVAGLCHGAYALEWEHEPWVDVERAGPWLLELAGELAVDVVHLNGYVHASLPWQAPVVVAGHSCVLSWHQAVRGSLPGSDVEAYRSAVARGIASADALVAPTGAMLAQLERLYGPRCRRVVISNGRDPRQFAARQKEPFVLGVGRLWDEAKNLEALDLAAGAISWPVMLAGDAGDRVAARAKLLGQLDAATLAELVGRAALFASPARYEPFGLAALEAGLSGCALVLGDIPSLREVWGTAATFVPSDDPQALASALERLIGDEPARRGAAQMARRQALQYSRTRMTAAYADLYARLARAAGNLADSREEAVA